MTQWVLIIMFVASPGPNDWIKIVPVESERACNDAIAKRGKSTFTPNQALAFDAGRISLMCVETPGPAVLTP